MKILVSIFLLCTFLTSSAQPNQEITTLDGHQFLVGKISVGDLQSEPYAQWYQPEFNNYAVDTFLVNMFQKKLAKLHIKLFLGTWCGDSKREVPRILKILKAANYPMNNLEIVALDRRKDFYKASPNGEEKGLNIVKVPTLIFLRDGKEINRIIERPIESLEEDMATIVQGKAYIPNYAYLKRAK